MAQSLASINMARGIRASASTVDRVGENLWFARGALRFPQGIAVLYNHFANKHPAEAMSHPYFIEPEYWPEQPSPQFQLTEEVQCLAVVARGSSMTRDSSTALDNTMSIIRNPRNEREFVLYNPIDVSDKTLRGIRDVIGDDGVVTKIIVPTRQTWQSAGEWCLQFPDAHVFCSGNVPHRFTKAGTEAAKEALARWKKENRWDERKREHEEKLAEERRLAEEAEEREANYGIKRRTRINTKLEGPLKQMREGKNTRWESLPAQIRQQQQMAGTMMGGTGVHPAASYMGGLGADDGMRLSKEDAEKRRRDTDLNRLGRSDSFSNAAFADDLPPDVRTQVTQVDMEKAGHSTSSIELPFLKSSKKKRKQKQQPQVDPAVAAEEDAKQQKELEEQLKQDDAPDDVADYVHILDPYKGLDIFDDGSARLLHVAGDRVTNEFVMYHAPTQCLACTDLYHGPYLDHDPMNTWLCRVWFKFQRDGNYKSETILPAYRKIQIEKHGNIREMQETIDDLTQAFPINRILAAHGSQPIVGDVSDNLRRMYNLHPLNEGDAAKPPQAPHE